MRDATATMAWEAGPGIGAWFLTAKDVLTAPRVTLRATPAAGLGRPFLFWLPGLVLGLIASMAGPLLFRGLQYWFADPVDAEYEAIRLAIGAAIRLGGALVALPALAAAAHLLLVLFASPHRPARGYEATFRTLAYTSGSVSPLLLIPCTGGAIALVWAICVAIPGLAAITETPVGAAAAALLIPLTLGCGLCIGASVAGSAFGVQI
jgi:hypothetical protein